MVSARVDIIAHAGMNHQGRRTQQQWRLKVCQKTEGKWKKKQRCTQLEARNSGSQQSRQSWENGISWENHLSAKVLEREKTKYDRAPKHWHKERKGWGKSFPLSFPWQWTPPFPHWRKNQLFIQKLLRIWWLKLWILWKMRLWNYEFCEKWDFQNVIFGFIEDFWLSVEAYLHHSNDRRSSSSNYWLLLQWWFRQNFCFPSIQRGE